MFFALVAATLVAAGASCFSAPPSPLNIAQPIVGETNQLHLDYAAQAPWSVQPSGDRLALVAQGSAGQLTYGGETYTAQYAELHSPAEHTLGAHHEVFPAELQLFHTSPSGKTLGLAVLFKEGEANELFDGVLSGLQHQATKVPVSLPSLLQTGGGYFSYSTPRCQGAQRSLGEADQWVLLSTMRQVSKEQIASLKRNMPELAKSSRTSVDPKDVTIFSSLVAPPAQPQQVSAAPAVPEVPALPAAPPAALIQGVAPPAALMQNGASAQQAQLEMILRAYPPEQRAQIQAQYKQWFDTYEAYLMKVQGQQTQETQALAYAQWQANQQHATDQAQEANVITGGIPMALLQQQSSVGLSQGIAAREAAVAAREQAVSVREQQLAALTQRMASPNQGVAASASVVPMLPLPAEVAQASAKVPEAPVPVAAPVKAAPAKAVAAESFAQVGAKVVATAASAVAQRVRAIGGGASDLHFLAAANLPADADDHEDAVTVAAANGDADGAEEDGATKGNVEDSGNTAATDAAGENADNDNMENILLQKSATTKRVRVAKQ